MKLKRKKNSVGYFEKFRNLCPRPQGVIILLSSKDSALKDSLRNLLNEDEFQCLSLNNNDNDDENHSKIFLFNPTSMQSSFDLGVI